MSSPAEPLTLPGADRSTASRNTRDRRCTSNTRNRQGFRFRFQFRFRVRGLSSTRNSPPAFMSAAISSALVRSPILKNASTMNASLMILREIRGVLKRGESEHHVIGLDEHIVDQPRRPDPQRACDADRSIDCHRPAASSPDPRFPGTRASASPIEESSHAAACVIAALRRARRSKSCARASSSA